MKVGFIGLGSLGKAIAGRLIETGVELSVWNRSKSKATGMAAAVADSPRELISKNDVVALCLSDSGAVKEVLEGEKGLLTGGLAGKIIIDHTTNHFEPVIGFHEQITKAGGFYLEAPVLGSVIPASKGLLTVLVSGEKTIYDKMLPYFEKVGKSIFFMGEPSLATRMKLVNNLVLGNLMAVLAEAVAFGEACGVEREKVIEILSKGAGDSGVLNGKREKLLKEDFSPHFSSAMIHKDLHYLQDLARRMKRPLLTGSVVKEIFGMTFREGLEKDDFSAVYRLFNK
mgnify:CR=1 FL=1